MRGHGEGTIWHNRKRGLYIVKVSLPDGRRLERSSRDPAIARRLLRDMLRLTGKGVEPRPRLTVRAYLADWLNDRRPPVIRAQTWERYESVVRVHLAPGLGSLGLQALRPSVVDGFLATKKGRTAQLCREVLRNALNDALRDRLVEYNAAELARPVAHEAAQPAILSPADLARFLEGTADDRLHAAYMLVAATGIREAELLGLPWTDVDFEAGTVTIQSQLVRLPGEWVLAPPKTRKGKRTIRVPRLVMDALAAHRRRMAAERKPDWEHFGLVFVTPHGQPIYGWRVVQMLRGHLHRLGIETPHPLRLHELRHGLASYMKADGVPDQVLADYLGHSTTRLIERYAHALPDSAGMVAERMERRLG